ncbi:unnamed protein product [Sphagnum compactum]
MCAAVPEHLVQSARPGFKPLWILSSRSGLDSANLPHRTYIQASTLRFGNRMEIEEVLQVNGGGTVGNALTADSGLGLNARIFTKVNARYLDFKNKRTQEPLWLKD